jgi:hypothetical protein
VAAEKAAIEAEQILRAIGDVAGLVDALCLRAELSHAAGAVDAARDLLAAADQLATFQAQRDAVARAGVAIGRPLPGTG